MAHEAPLVRMKRWINSKLAAGEAFWNERMSGPFAFIFGLIARMFRLYKAKIWNRFARGKDGEYTKTRISGTILGTLVGLWMIPQVLLGVWQVALFQFTWRDEVLYLTSAEEIDPENEVHAVRGCRQIPCSEADAVYFRVRSTLLHNGWSLYSRGGMFYPEEVAGIIAPGVNSCEVQSYGIRVKALMRGWGVYPDMLNAVCVPYSETGAAPLGVPATPAQAQNLE